MAAQVQWCLGMYGSASTWLYNVVRRINAAARPAQLVQTHFFSGATDFAAFEQADLAHIVKSHEISDETTLAALGRRATKILVTIRDPRDAVTSLMLYHGHNFEKALGLVETALRLCQRFAADERAMTWHYESGFFDDPATLDQIARHLGLTLSAPLRAQIFEAMQRREVEKFIAAMPQLPGVLQDRLSGDRLDPRSHWHTHHAGRDGEIGRWRHRLNAAQVRQVEARTRDCYG